MENSFREFFSFTGACSDAGPSSAQGSAKEVPEAGGWAGELLSREEASGGGGRFERRGGRGARLGAFDPEHPRKEDRDREVADGKREGVEVEVAYQLPAVGRTFGGGALAGGLGQQVERG